MTARAQSPSTAQGTLEPLKDGIGCENPILCQSLGICSALAVTNQLDKTLVMCASLAFVATLSCAAVSALRRFTPRRVRMIVQMLVISTLVILVDLYMKSHWVHMRSALGPYLELIITNCLIMGRCEAFAARNGPLRSAMDGLGSAAGYSLVLCAIAIVREPFGSGTLLGYVVFPAGYEPIRLFAAAPGAFLVMGLVVWIVRGIRPDLGRDPCEVVF